MKTIGDYYVIGNSAAKHPANDLGNHILDLAHRLRILTSRLRELREIIENPDAPSIGGLPQVDLASRWYVTLATAVERATDDVVALPREIGVIPTPSERADL